MKSRFWSAFALSALGYEITFFATTLVVFNRSRNPFDVGLFTALTFAPQLLAPFFGMVSARIGGRTGLSAACGIAGVLIACVGILKDALPLFVVWILISCLFVFISNVRTTLMSGSFAAFYATLVSLHSLRDRSTSSESRGVVYGTITAAGVPPAVISMLVGSFMIRTMGIQSVLVACGACATGCLVLWVVLFGRWSSNREGAQAGATPERSQRKGEEFMSNEQTKIEGFQKSRNKADAYYQEASPAYRAFQELAKQAFRPGALEKRVKEMIAIAISIVVKCEPCIEHHVREALQDGATEEQIVEAIEVAFEMGGGPATVQARFALEAMEHYRPRQ
ncbi:MAG: carboxymuconolactone decarboxylase family protein [Spirochaetia bacterium]|jgi:AhpD family alkylhydroperoxidase